MFKYFLKAFRITNENIILTTPLVLFLLLFSIYIGFTKYAQGTAVLVILSLLTAFLMLGAFFAGWFFMIKRAVEINKIEFSSDEEKAKASLSLLKELPCGIGEYFFSFIGGLILYVGLIGLLSFIGYKTGMHFIGKVDLNPLQLKAALDSPAAMKALVSSLSVEQSLRLQQWYFLFFTTVLFFYFSTFFWPATIIFKTKNPLKAFFQSFIFTYKNFLSSVALFVYISFVNLSVSLAINLLAVIPSPLPILTFALSLLSMIIYFYFIVYVIVLIFLYYDSKTNKTIEQTESNCNCGTDSVGEEQICDSNSDEN